MGRRSTWGQGTPGVGSWAPAANPGKPAVRWRNTRQRRPGNPSSRPVTRGTREARGHPAKRSPRALRTPSKASASHGSCAPAPASCAPSWEPAGGGPSHRPAGVCTWAGPSHEAGGGGAAGGTQLHGGAGQLSSREPGDPAPAGPPLPQGRPAHFFWKLLPGGREDLCWGGGRSGLRSTESSWGRSERGALLPARLRPRPPGKSRQNPAPPWLWGRAARCGQVRLTTSVTDTLVSRAWKPLQGDGGAELLQDNDRQGCQALCDSACVTSKRFQLGKVPEEKGNATLLVRASHNPQQISFFFRLDVFHAPWATLE